MAARFPAWRLVDGIARNGKWLDRAMKHQMQAVDFTASPYDHLERDEVDDVETGHSPRHAPLSDLEESESHCG